MPELAKGELRWDADMPLTTQVSGVLPAGTMCPPGHIQKE